MNQRAFQDYYPDELSYCYGCGRLNEQGLKLKSYWDGEETVAIFNPRPYHIAIPGYVYGGLIASIIDCHGTGTAAAATYRAEGREMGTEPPVAICYGVAACGVYTPYATGSAAGSPWEGKGDQGA